MHGDAALDCAYCCCADGCPAHAKYPCGCGKVPAVIVTWATVEGNNKKCSQQKRPGNIQTQAGSSMDECKAFCEGTAGCTHISFCNSCYESQSLCILCEEVPTDSWSANEVLAVTTAKGAKCQSCEAGKYARGMCDLPDGLPSPAGTRPALRRLLLAQTEQSCVAQVPAT